MMNPHTLNHHSVSTTINSRPSQFHVNPLSFPLCHMLLLVLTFLVLPRCDKFSEI